MSKFRADARSFSTAMGSITSEASIDSYIPPKWSDITPLLYYSTLLWIILFVFAVFREVLNLVLTTKRLNNTRNPVWLQLSYKYKDFRSGLLNRQIAATELIWNIVLPRCIMGAAICTFYCIDTIFKRVTPIFYYLQVFYGIVVFVVLVYEFIYSSSPIYFVFRLGTLVECLTIPSLVLASRGLWLNFNFLQAYSILSLWYTLEQHHIVLRNATSLTRLYFSISLELATFVFITACGVHFFELLGDPGDIGDKTFQITWANSLYFAVVTLMTVGYGDFVPYTLFGRVWIVVHIIRAAYLVVREMDFFFQTEKRQKRGIEAYVETIECSHVVVTGHVKWEFLKQFIFEFLREGENANTKVLVLTSSPTWSNDDWDKVIARNMTYDYRVFFVDGSPLESSDLERARVISARAVFVMSDPHRGDPYREDASTLKTILSIRKFGGSVPIFSFHISQNSSAQFNIAMEQVEDDLFEDLVVPESFANEALFTEHAAPPRQTGGHDNESTTGSLPEPLIGNVYAGEPEEEPLLSNRDSASRFRMWPYADIPAVAPPQRPGESLCTQELEMALLAENVFCNGLSTLIANLTLRLAPVPQPSDRSWLLEYKLGAQCCIFSISIPEQFDKRIYRDISTILQDYGITFLAYSEDGDDNSKIITVDTQLKKNMKAMIITYHQLRLIPWIIEKVIDSLQTADESEQAGDNGEHAYLRHNEMHSRYGSYGDWMPPQEFQRRRDSRVPTGIPRTRSDGDEIQRGPPMTAAALDAHSQKYSDAATPHRSSLKDSTPTDPERRKKNVNFERKSKPQRGFANMFQMPGNLSGHVIVCLDGESSLTSLKALLKRIWKKRREKRTRTKVVVIHPNFPKNFDREIQTAGNDLYLVRGHSLSVQVLDQAQYKQSRAMLILATENREAESTRNTDCKAIFTVMTLDSLLDRARIYVCCMLDDEDSLRLMRAPKHPRQIAFSREDSLGLPRTESGVNKRSSSATSLSMVLGHGRISRGPSSVFSRNIPPTNRTGSFLTGDQTPYGSESDELLSQGQNGSGRGDKYRSEGELCERQRYASGEMIISSLFAALLVREEAQPGYNRVIRGLLGLSDSGGSATSTSSTSNSSHNSIVSGSWIRLLKIPEAWTDLGRPHGKTYRETSVLLQGLGCIAIGLYRSGHAPVRHVLSSTQGIWARNATDVYYSEETERDALMHHSNSNNAFTFPLPASSSRGSVRPETMRLHEGHRESQYDEMDKATYRCPTTKRLIEYVETACDNVLPYVYCLPEPYTTVDHNDGVFVICDPDLDVPADWGVKSSSSSDSKHDE